MAAPTIATFNPQVQPPSGGSTIVVIGSGFTGATSVQWGTQSVAFTVVADTRITFVAPSGHTGGSYITVTTPQGSVQSSATLSLLSGTNALVSANPTSGAKGSTVNLTGTGMASLQHYIYFAPGSQDSSYTISSATAASVVVANRPIGPSQIQYYNGSVGTTEGILDFTITGTPVQISTLQDNFNGGSISSTLWTNSSPSNVTLVNNQIQMVVAAGTYGQYYLSSQNFFDLTNNGVYAQIVNPGNQSLSSVQAYIGVYDYQGYYQLTLSVKQNQVLAAHQLGGVTTTLASIPYSPALHQYFRIREASGTLYWDTSPDAVNWTNLYNEPDPPAFPLTQLRFWLLCYSYQETPAVTFVFDNVGTYLPKLASVTNDFSSGINSPWAVSGSGPSTVTVVNNQLQLTVPANTASCNGQLVTYSGGYLYYDLTASSIVVQVVNAGAQDPNVELWCPQLIDNSGPWYGWHIINGMIQVNNYGTIVRQAQFSAAVFKWLRIRESGGTTYYDYSSDGSNWILFASHPDQASASQVRPNLYLGTNSPGVNVASTVLLDNISLPPPTAPGLSATSGLSIGTAGRVVPVGTQGRIYNLVPNRNYQANQVQMGASAGMAVGGTDIRPGAVALSGATSMAVRNPVLSASQKMATLTDNFNLTYIDSTKWIVNQNGAGIASTGGYLTWSLPANSPIGSGGTVYAGSGTVPNAFYDLTESYAVIQLVSAGNQADTTHQVLFTFMLYDQDGNDFGWGIQGNQIFWLDENGQHWNPQPYSPSTYQWLRIREHAGYTYFDYSADGSIWSNFAQVNDNNWIYNPPRYLQPALQFDSQNAAISAQTCQVDNFNLPPPVGIGMSGSAGMTVGGLATEVATVAESATAGMSVMMGALIIQGSVFGPVPMLSAAEQEFETGIGGWYGTANTSIAQSTAAAHIGTHCLAITSTSVTAPYTVQARYAVGPGQTYQSNFYVSAPSTTRTVYCRTQYLDSGLNGFSGTSVNLTETTGTWQNYYTAPTVGPAPPNAAWVSVQWYCGTALPVNEVHYLDTAFLNWLPGANTTMAISTYQVQYQSVAMAASTGMTIGSTVTELAQVTLAGGASLSVSAALAQSATVAESASASLAVVAAPVIIKGGVFGPVPLLSAVDAEFETGVGTWTAISNCTVSQTNAAAHIGSYSLGVSAGGTGNAQANSGYYPITPGQAYSAAFYGLAATVGRSYNPQVYYYSASYAFLAGAGNTFTDNTTGWTTNSVYAQQAPATAAYATLRFMLYSLGGIGETHYIDTAALNLQPGGQTTMTVGAMSIEAASTSFAATTGMTVAASVAQLAAVTLAGGASLSVTGQAIGAGGLVLSSDTALTVGAAVTEVANVTLTGNTGIAISTSQVGVAALSATASLSVTALVQQVASAPMTGVASLTVVGVTVKLGVTTMAAVAAMTVTAAPMTIQGTVFGPTHLLSGNDADFETGVGSWTAVNYCTIAQTTAASHTGSGSLAITSTSSTYTSSARMGNTVYPAVPGVQYTASFWASAATTSRTVNIQMNFYNATGGQITGYSVGVTDQVGSWTKASIPSFYAAPAGTAYVGVYWVGFSAQAVGEVHYIDTVVMDQAPGANAALNVLAATTGTSGLSGTAGMNVGATLTTFSSVTLAGGASLKIQPGALSGPNYGQIGTGSTDGIGAWINPQYAQGAPDGRDATWTAP